MHGELRRTVIPDHISWNALAEIGLDRVYTLVQQLLDLVLEPFTCFRVGEIHQPHARLPKIGLPDFAIGLLDKVAFLLAFLEHGTTLADVRINPCADMQTLILVQTLECGFDISEETLVPFEIGPMEFTHPVAVVVECAQRNIAFGHAIDEGVDGLLVILGSERSGEPQSIAPGGHVGRAADQLGIAVKNLLRRRTVDHTEIDGLPRHRELHGLSVFRSHFEGDVPTVVHQHTVSVGCHVERNVLIALLGSGTAVLIPDIDGLAVLYIRAESFAEAVHILANAEMQLDSGEHIRFVIGRAVHGHAKLTYRLCRHIGKLVQIETAKRLSRRFGKHFAIFSEERQIPWSALDHFRSQTASGQGHGGTILAHFAIAVAFRGCVHISATTWLVSVQRKSRIVSSPLPVPSPDANHTFRRRGHINVERR